MIRVIVAGFFILCSGLAVSAQGLPQAACTRADLQSSVDGYLAAQRSGNPTSLPLTACKLRFVHSLTVCTVPNCGFTQRAPAPAK